MCPACIAWQNQAPHNQALHMQGRHVWLLGWLEPGCIELVIGCMDAWKFQCKMPVPHWPLHAGSRRLHERSLAPRRSSIWAYHGSQAARGILHPARLAREGGQRTKQTRQWCTPRGIHPTNHALNWLRILQAKPCRCHIHCHRHSPSELKTMDG
jgi:hypothetical protein